MVSYVEEFLSEDCPVGCHPCDLVLEKFLQGDQLDRTAAQLTQFFKLYHEHRGLPPPVKDVVPC